MIIAFTNPTLSLPCRLPEAALFCRAYAPSRMPPVVAAWKEDLQVNGSFLHVPPMRRLGSKLGWPLQCLPMLTSPMLAKTYKYKDCGMEGNLGIYIYRGCEVR